MSTAEMMSIHMTTRRTRSLGSSGGAGGVVKSDMVAESLSFSRFFLLLLIPPEAEKRAEEKRRRMRGKEKE
jgi:hypothetical protein